jgi:hypothetical protein
MRKYLRIAVTGFCLTACMLLIALWASSYATRDSVFWPWIDHAVQVTSLKGHVVVGVVGKEPAARWEPFKIEHSAIEGRFKTLFDNDVLGFYFERKPGELRFDVPHWFLVLLGMMTAAAAWRHEKWRFSLRTLLIATTLLAVALGILATVR